MNIEKEGKETVRSKAYQHHRPDDHAGAVPVAEVPQ